MELGQDRVKKLERVARKRKGRGGKMCSSKQKIEVI